MNKREFFNALRRALAILPDEERANVIKYYEDYFLDAEGLSEEEIIQSLGSPQKIAEDILRDYRELKPHANPQSTTPPRRKGISPWMLVVLVFFAIPIGVPVAAALFAAGVSVVAALGAAFIAIAVALFCIPVTLLALGAAFIAASFFVWHMPPSAVLSLGAGFICLSLGGLAALLYVKLLRSFVPPLFRAIINIFRTIFIKIRGLFR